MNEKTVLAAIQVTQTTSPITQSIDAVKALLAYVGRSSDPLPTDVSFDNGRMVLVLNGKKDAYYTCTAKACSCPAAHWNRGPCEHQRKYFPQPEATKLASAKESFVYNSGSKTIARA